MFVGVFVYVRYQKSTNDGVHTEHLHFKYAEIFILEGLKFRNL